MNQQYLQMIVGLKPLPSEPAALKSLIEYAKKQHVLGQMAHVWRDKGSGKLEEIFANAIIQTAADHRQMIYERNRVEVALQGSDITPIILKGGAYVNLELRASMGRRVSDLDILVPYNRIKTTAKYLEKAGWETDASVNNNYDKAFYRKWSHELPPMRHKSRGTILDIHHRLESHAAKISLNHEKMMADASMLDGGRSKTFTAIDLFIHSASHAFSDGEFATPARSLIELYYLYQNLNPEQRRALISRAIDVGGLYPVQISLWALARYFGLECLKSDQKVGLLVGFAIRVVVDDSRLKNLGLFMLYVRGHYMRMPLKYLIPHFVRKLFIRQKKPHVLEFLK